MSCDFSSLEIIGQGGHGIVKRGRCRRSGRLVAIKRVHIGSRNLGLAASAVREVTMLRVLSHQNIVKMYDVCLQGANVHIVLEHIINDLPHGLRLNESKGLPEALVAIIILDVLKALGYLHRNNILHRDVKPANLLIDESYHVKLSDFGSAYFGPCVGETLPGASWCAAHVPNSEYLPAGNISVPISPRRPKGAIVPVTNHRCGGSIVPTCSPSPSPADLLKTPSPSYPLAPRSFALVPPHNFASPGATRSPADPTSTPAAAAAGRTSTPAAAAAAAGRLAKRPTPGARRIATRGSPPSPLMSPRSRLSTGSAPSPGAVRPARRTAHCQCLPLGEGTPQYTAPEQLLRTRIPISVSAEDTWGAGVTTLELMIGTPLFAECTEMALLKAIADTLGALPPTRDCSANSSFLDSESVGTPLLGSKEANSTFSKGSSTSPSPPAMPCRSREDISDTACTSDAEMMKRLPDTLHCHIAKRRHESGVALCTCGAVEHNMNRYLLERSSAGWIRCASTCPSPVHLSLAAEDAIRRMLEVNPMHRVSAQDMQNHGFFTQYQHIVFKPAEKDEDLWDASAPIPALPEEIRRQVAKGEAPPPDPIVVAWKEVVPRMAVSDLARVRGLANPTIQSRVPLKCRVKSMQQRLSASPHRSVSVALPNRSIAPCRLDPGYLSDSSCVTAPRLLQLSTVSSKCRAFSTGADERPTPPIFSKNVMDASSPEWSAPRPLHLDGMSMSPPDRHDDYAPARPLVHMQMSVNSEKNASHVSSEARDKSMPPASSPGTTISARVGLSSVEPKRQRRASLPSFHSSTWNVSALSCGRSHLSVSSFDHGAKTDVAKFIARPLDTTESHRPSGTPPLQTVTSEESMNALSCLLQSALSLPGSPEASFIHSDDDHDTSILPDGMLAQTKLRIGHRPTYNSLSMRDPSEAHLSQKKKPGGNPWRLRPTARKDLRNGDYRISPALNKINMPKLNMGAAHAVSEKRDPAPSHHPVRLGTYSGSEPRGSAYVRPPTDIVTPRHRVAVPDKKMRPSPLVTRGTVSVDSAEKGSSACSPSASSRGSPRSVSRMFTSNTSLASDAGSSESDILGLRASSQVPPIRSRLRIRNLVSSSSSSIPSPRFMQRPMASGQSTRSATTMRSATSVRSSPPPSFAGRVGPHGPLKRSGGVSLYETATSCKRVADDRGPGPRINVSGSAPSSGMSESAPVSKDIGARKPLSLITNTIHA